MTLSARTATREIGTALAVLAIYLLTVLLPLHQAAASQRDFDALGYATLDSWSVCTQLAEDEQGKPSEAAALKCPAVGVAKQQIAVVLPPAIVIQTRLDTAPIRYSMPVGLPNHLPPDHVGQSRAPPVSA